MEAVLRARLESWYRRVRVSRVANSVSGARSSGSRGMLEPMEDEDDQWGIALGRRPASRHGGVRVLMLSLVQLWAAWRKRGYVQDAVASAVEVATVLGERAKQSDERADRMSALAEEMNDMTQSMKRYAQVSTATAAASLIVAVVALVLPREPLVGH